MVIVAIERLHLYQLSRSIVIIKLGVIYMTKIAEKSKQEYGDLLKRKRPFTRYGTT